MFGLYEVGIASWDWSGGKSWKLYVDFLMLRLRVYFEFSYIDCEEVIELDGFIKEEM